MRAFAAPSPLSFHVPPLAVVEPRPSASIKDGSRSDAVGDRPKVRDDAPRQTPDPRAPDPALDPYLLTGPKPAFEANVLDTQRTVEAILARIKLQQSRAETAKAMGDPAAPAAPRSVVLATSRPAGQPAAEGDPPSDAADRSPSQASAPGAAAAVGADPPTSAGSTATGTAPAPAAIDTVPAEAA